MRIEIKSWNTGEVIHSLDQEGNTLAKTVEDAVKKGISLEFANLVGVDLQYSDLSKANLCKARLDGAYLLGANLFRANLSEAYLLGATLSEARLYEANLEGANLKEADLTGANLSFASLAEANLSGADLRGAYLLGANLSGADLSEANVIKTMNSKPKGKASKTNLDSKIPYHLVPKEAMDSISLGFLCGIKKGYKENDWQLGHPYSVNVGALLRHVFKFASGEDFNVEYDSDGNAFKTHHLDNAMANLAMLVTNIKRERKDLDDRYKNPDIEDRE